MGITAGIIEQRGADIIIEVKVSDTGIGIREDMQHMIFEPFTQIDGKNTRQFGGTGLGLSIASRLTELMGGSIALDSIENTGSTFSVRIPFSIPAMPVAKAETSKVETTTEPLDILVAEDNKINVKFLKVLLNKMGHRASFVVNGEEALAELALHHYDVVLMDILMPVMQGDEALLKIREKEQATGLHLPVVALTANALDGDRGKYLGMGFDGYLSKPVSMQDIAIMLKEIARRVRN